MRSFLIRGMLAGLCAGLVAFGFAKLTGESAVDRAIAFEDQQLEANGQKPEPDMVSRTVQSTLGLATGLLATGVALGGFFAIAFAFAYGRLGRLDVKATALAVAGLGFVAVHLMPFLKYPANPPAVGHADTLNYRTELYFFMIAVSIASMVLAVDVARRLVHRHGTWNATLAGAGAYLAVMTFAIVALPVIDEVPDGFPASALWQFRISALGIQATLWTTIGLVFGALMQRSASRSARRQSSVSTAT